MALKASSSRRPSNPFGLQLADSHAVPEIQMSQGMDQPELWHLVYSTIRPKNYETSNECLNRLAREYFGQSHVPLSEASALIFRKVWSQDELRLLERHHRKIHDFDDNRPLVVVQCGTRKAVIDGNHRLTRWLQEKQLPQYQVLLLRLRGEISDIYL